MFILLEILLVAVVAVLVARLAAEPWRGRALNVMKFWVTIRALLWPPPTISNGSPMRSPNGCRAR